MSKKNKILESRKYKDSNQNEKRSNDIVDTLTTSIIIHNLTHDYSQNNNNSESCCCCSLLDCDN